MQIDSARVGGVNENIAILLLAAKFGVPVCPHAGGVGLCEMVQHLSMFDYVAVSGTTEDRVIEYVDHLHEHFVDPVRDPDGHYLAPTAPGTERADARGVPQGVHLPRRPRLDRPCLTAPALVDAHHHVWDLDQRPQPWLDEPGHEPIRRTFSSRRPAIGRDPADRRTAAGRARWSSSASRPCPRPAELLALAGGDPLIGAVVGWADLTSPAVGDMLDDLLAGPGGTYLRALRHLVQGESDPRWLQRPDVERGLAAVGERGLGYDVLVRSHQLTRRSDSRNASRAAARPGPRGQAAHRPG